MNQVKKLLSAAPMVTLIGAGGCGKTRLALEVAASVACDYSHGTWLVDLAPVSDPHLVASTVARALDVHETENQSFKESISNFLGHKRLLLLLDNCEHVIQSCAELASGLLSRCPELKILATSREPLAIAGETVWRVPSLSLPDKDAIEAEALMQCDAVSLFVARAQSALPSFELAHQNAETMAQICRRLDGIPLAIELAAVRVRALAIDEILDRLDHRFELLSGGLRTAPPRQRTLRATVDWSYELLDAKETALLARLSIFAGGWTLQAAEAVCAESDAGTIGIDSRKVPNLLARLVDKSMVVTEEGRVEQRYHMLETLRQYGLEKLKAAVVEQTVRARHIAWFIELARHSVD